MMDLLGKIGLWLLAAAGALCAVVLVAGAWAALYAARWEDSERWRRDPDQNDKMTRR